MIGELLASALVATLITFRKELSGKTDIPAPRFAVELEDEESTSKPNVRKESVNVERPAHQQDLVRKALAAMETENHKQALSLVERLLNLDQADPFYHLLLGDCYAKLGRIQEALRSYDTVMDYDGKRYTLPDRLRLATKEQIETLERIQAEEGSSKAEKSGGELPLTHHLRGVMERLSLIHSEMQSKYPEIKTLLDGAVASYNEGDFDKALDYATKLTKLQPRVGQFHMLCGACNEGRGDFTEALKDYEKASGRRLPDYLGQEVEAKIMALKKTTGVSKKTTGVLVNYIDPDKYTFRAPRVSRGEIGWQRVR
jgi:tetratricopeptide (TPR) repeat protein